LHHPKAKHHTPELRHTPKATPHPRKQLDNLVHVNGLLGFCSEYDVGLPEDIIEDVPRKGLQHCKEKYFTIYAICRAAFRDMMKNL
jgi:hypothetical protein